MSLKNPYHVLFYEGSETDGALLRLFEIDEQRTILKGTIEEVNSKEFEEAILRTPVVFDNDYTKLYVYPEAPYFKRKIRRYRDVRF